MVTLLLKCRVTVCVSLMSVYCAAAFVENMGVDFHVLRVHEFFEKVLEFDIGRSLKVLESHGI